MLQHFLNTHPSEFEDDFLRKKKPISLNNTLLLIIGTVTLLRICELLIWKNPNRIECYVNVSL